MPGGSPNASKVSAASSVASSLKLSFARVSGEYGSFRTANPKVQASNSKSCFIRLKYTPSTLMNYTRNRRKTQQSPGIMESITTESSYGQWSQ